MGYTRARIMRELLKLEQELWPEHRHQGIITVKATDDPDELLAMAMADCRRHGCHHGILLVPETVSPDDWSDTVRREYEDMD